MPGFASTEEEYQGSRKANQRLEYSEKSTAGFAELATGRIPSQQEFFQALKSAPDVEEVGWKDSKVSGFEGFPGQCGRPLHGAEHQCVGPRL